MHPRSLVGYEPDDWVPRCVGGSRLPILNHGLVTHGYYLRATDPREQVTEVVRRFHLARYFTPFTRCMACNGALIPVAKKEIAHRLSPETSRHVDDFRVCSSCNKVYWQ